MYLSKCPYLEIEPLCLRATGAGITEIDMLAPNQTDTLSLFVSHNQISKIDKIVQFKSLERLLIEYNQILYLEDLYPLSELTKLKELRLTGNPVCRMPLFFYYIVYLVPSLENINGINAIDLFNQQYTHKELKHFVQCENKLLRLITLADYMIKYLKTNPHQKLEYPNTVDSEAAQEYTQQELMEKYFEIRNSAGEIPKEKYFDFLRDLLLQKHQEIAKLIKSATIVNPKTRLHRDQLSNDFPSENIDKMIRDLTDLHDSARFIIEQERPEGYDGKSALTSVFNRKFNLGCARSVCSRVSILRSKNDGASTIAGNTDAMSILSYYIDDDKNGNDGRSTKSARSTRSSLRKQRLMNQLKNGSPRSGKYRRRGQNAEISSQASIDDVALNIEDGKITLIDPKHPEDQNGSFNNDNNDQNNQNNESNEQKLIDLPEANKGILKSKQGKNPDKKVTLIFNKDTSNNAHTKKPKEVTHRTYLFSTMQRYKYFGLWKLKYQQSIVKNGRSSHYRLNDIALLKQQNVSMSEEIEYLMQNQKALTEHEQTILLIEATKRRDLLRKIDNLKDILNHSVRRATQFKAEMQTKEQYISDSFLT